MITQPYPTSRLGLVVKAQQTNQKLQQSHAFETLADHVLDRSSDISKGSLLINPCASRVIVIQPPPGSAKRNKRGKTLRGLEVVSIYSYPPLPLSFWLVPTFLVFCYHLTWIEAGQDLVA